MDKSTLHDRPPPRTASANAAVGLADKVGDAVVDYPALVDELVPAAMAQVG